jgi:hypothetical protein
MLTHKRKLVLDVSRQNSHKNVFVVSWRCKEQRLLGLLLSARQVSAYGTKDRSWRRLGVHVVVNNAP